jgi:hypothetical protein
MISWQLWLALHRPPVFHPLYQRVLKERHDSVWRHAWWFVAAGAILLLFAFPALLLPLVLISPVLGALFAATLNGINWTAHIASTIAYQRRHNLFDIIAVSPEGPFNICWILATARLHYQDSLDKALTEAHFIIQFIGLGGLMLVIGLLIAPTSEQRLQALVGFLILMTLMAAIYIDYAQTVVTSVLIGILAGHATRSAIDSRLWAMVGFITLQVTLYLIGFVLIFVISPLVRTALGLDSIVISMISPALLLLFFAGLREVIVRVLWNAVQHQLNAEPQALEHLQESQSSKRQFRPSHSRSELLDH